MANSGETAGRKSNREATAGRMPPERAAEPERNDAGKKAGAIFFRPLPAIHSRPVMTMLLTASIIVFGILTYNQLAVNDLPAVDYPVIQVSVSYPGANPETMANTIATPLEKQFTQIPGLEPNDEHELAGQHQITLQFDLSKGIDAAATDVQSAIQRATGQLPSDLPSPPDFHQDQSERSAGHVHRPDERHFDRRRTLSLRHDPGAAADQYFARRFAGQHLWREGRDSDQGRSRRACHARA